MNTNEGLRYHARFAVKWPVTYGNEELFGRGTVLDVSHAACQLAGTMPVAVGMRLKLWIAPPHRENSLCVDEARVLWVKDHGCGLEFRGLSSRDQRWLMGFLETAERRNSFQRLLQSPSKMGRHAARLAVEGMKEDHSWLASYIHTHR